MNVADLVAGLARWMGRAGLWSLMLTRPLAIVSSSPVPFVLSLALLVVPVVVTVTQLALFRSWEYDADLDAVIFTRDPDGLARALITLDNSNALAWGAS